MSCIWESLPGNCTSNPEKRFEEHFSRDTSYYYRYYKGKRDDNPHVELYYFSNTIDKVFDRSKVGKLTSGKYIIKNTPMRVEIYEILKITNKRIDIKANSLNHFIPRYKDTLTFKSKK